MSPHLAIAPILIPLATAALQLMVGARRRRLWTGLSLLSCILLVLTAAGLIWTVGGSGDTSRTLVYNLGNWPAHLAIVLVVDRLSALMLLLTAVLACVVTPYALGRWQRTGAYFQPLMQLLLLGLNGAFLTGDLFNLFVFFEVMLAASYGLALHGSGRRRTGAGLHYVAINLAASMLFLIGVSMVFGVTGTLNMAELARKIPTLGDENRLLMHGGAALLGLAFLVKTAIWPLGFWLPRTYASAMAPVAAMFTIMTKLGIYVLLRLSLLLFGIGAGTASAHFGSTWLLVAGLITLGTGTIGMLGARELGKLAGFAVLISSGTLLAAIALQETALTAGALAYLVVSALGVAGLFLLTGLIVPHDEPEEVGQLEPYDPVGDTLYGAEDESRGVRQAPVVLAISFLVCALLVTGLPPLPGFLAKFAILAPLLAAGNGGAVLFALIIAATVSSLVALCRAGIQIFWADSGWIFPQVRPRETACVVALLAVSVGLTVFAAGPWKFLTATAQQLHEPNQYIQAVLQTDSRVQP